MSTHASVVEAALRKEIVASYQSLARAGLLALSAGNVSCRFADGMLISASGVSADSIREENIVFVDAQGQVRNGLKPSSEWQMHAAIYRQHTTAQAVVHTHSDYCVAMACQAKSLPGFHYMVGMLGARAVPCVPYHTFGSEALAEAAAAGVTESAACLLAQHGMITRGANLQEACRHAELLELLSKQYLLSASLGKPAELSSEEWDAFFVQMQQTGYSEV